MKKSKEEIQEKIKKYFTGSLNKIIYHQNLHKRSPKIKNPQIINIRQQIIKIKELKIMNTAQFLMKKVQIYQIIIKKVNKNY